MTTRLPGSKAGESGKAPGKPAAEAEEEKSQIEFLAGKKARDTVKPIEVVFVKEADKARMLPVKRGISDDSHYEVTEGVAEGQEIITGNFKAVSKDLDDGATVEIEEPKKAQASKP